MNDLFMIFTEQKIVDQYFMHKKNLFLLSLLISCLISGIFASKTAEAQSAPKTFTRADTLRGSLSPLRTCYDINYYHLDVKLDIDKKFISGSNRFVFTVKNDFKKLQFDLFANMRVDSVLYKKQRLAYTREANAVFIDFPKPLKKGSKDEFTVYYSGHPKLAEENGFEGWVFTRDSVGKPFVTVNCEGVGASSWWPNKDHLSDEVDSMLISVSVPKGLKDVSNGRLRKITKLKDGYNRFDWFVANPINNYDVTVNVADYVHFSDSYLGEKGKLSLDYWVLPTSLKQAKTQFEANVKPMLKSFESWFGPYPFYEDGYKLVEAPYLGMEHQGAIAYGNHYQDGYLGRDITGSGWGSKWDYIIIHESAHEWFGNNITATDPADLWIHESFATYAESIYTESRFGKEAGKAYNNGLQKMIKNDIPIVAPYGVNQVGSMMDVYMKGATLLGMVRIIIDNDTQWKSILRGLGTAFYHKTVNYDDVVNYINTHSGKDLTAVFDQYLHYKNLPTLEFTMKDGKLFSRWIADANKFNMPVQVSIKGGPYQLIKPTSSFSPVPVEGANLENIEVNTKDFYIAIRKT